MNGGTEVIINTTRVEAQIVASGIAVTLVNESLPETMIGVPGPVGPKGADGADGIDGAPGTAGANGMDGVGLPPGGAPGQVILKNTAADYDTAWAPNNYIDPVTGRVFVGTIDPATALVPVTTDPDDKLNLVGGNLILDTGFAIKRNSGLGYSVAQIVIGGGPFNGPAMKSVELQALSTGVKAALWLNGKNTNPGDSIFAVNLSGNQPTLQMTPSGKMRLGAEWLPPVNYLDIVSGGMAIGYNYRNTVAPNYGAIIEGDVGIGTSAPSATLHVAGPVRIGASTVLTAPNAASVGAGTIIYISDEIGGPVIAFSDGTNWRRMTDRVVVG